MTNHSEQSITLLIQGLRGAPHISDPATQKIWNRYFDSLFRLASQRLSPKIRVRRDAEDVVLDVFATFFMRIQRGQFEWVNDRRDLMRILVSITVNKVLETVRGEGAAKRDVGREMPQGRSGDPFDPQYEAQAFDASPEDAAILHDLCDRALSLLDEQHLEIALLHMKGASAEEIGARFNLSERSIHRKLEYIEKFWSENGIIDPFAEEGEGRDKKNVKK